MAGQCDGYFLPCQTKLTPSRFAHSPPARASRGRQHRPPPPCPCGPYPWHPPALIRPVLCWVAGATRQVQRGEVDGWWRMRWEGQMSHHLHHHHHHHSHRHHHHPHRHHHHHHHHHHHYHHRHHKRRFHEECGRLLLHSLLLRHPRRACGKTGQWLAGPRPRRIGLGPWAGCAAGVPREWGREDGGWTGMGVAVVG